jgi:predicted MFS family arabinose efflux permease
MRLGGLWRHPDFMRLWIGQTISEFGSVVTRDALPLLAVLTLSATPAQMGVLAALGSLPALLIGLPAGAWVDRLRRKPIMIASDVASAALLVTIPIAWLLGALRIEQLYVVAALAGALALLFDVAYTSYLPSLVDREHVVEGNSKLSASESVAEVGGSALAGALVQILSAPLTILIDAASFLVSAVSLLLIHKPEPRPAPVEQPNLRREIADGLRALFGQPVLRAMALARITATFFGNFYAALYVMYAIRELGIGPAVLGLIIASGGIGSFLGALLAGPLARRLRLGTLLIGCTIVGGALGLLTPLAAGQSLVVAATFLFVGQISGDMLDTVYLIHALSLRQVITSDAMLGRMNASMEFLQGGVATAGVLAGGLLGEAIGVRGAVWIAALGSGAEFLWLLFSPVRALRVMPAEGLT